MVSAIFPSGEARHVMGKGKRNYATKSTTFWVEMLYSPVKVHQHFGGTYCLSLFREEEQALGSISKAASFVQVIACLAHSSTLNMETIVPLKCQ
jgi:hypothetical protein